MNNSENGLKPLTCTVPDGLKILGIGRTKLYELIGSGKIETVNIGRRRLLKYRSLEALAQGGAA